MVRSQTTCSECPPPAAQPGTTQTTTFGMVRISRCTSSMCSRPPSAATRAASTVSAVSPCGVLVARAPADALVAAGAERPAAVARRRAVAGEQHGADVGRPAGVVEGAVQLVDGVRAERVAYLRTVERDPHRGPPRAVEDAAVVRDVGERESLDLLPRGRVEDLRDLAAGSPGRCGCVVCRHLGEDRTVTRGPDAGPGRRPAGRRPGRDGRRRRAHARAVPRRRPPRGGAAAGPAGLGRVQPVRRVRRPGVVVVAGQRAGERLVRVAGAPARRRAGERHRARGRRRTRSRACSRASRAAAR